MWPVGLLYYLIRNVFCSHFNVLNSIINIILTIMVVHLKKETLHVHCFVVVHHKSCIDMVKIIIHSPTRNNYRLVTNQVFLSTKCHI